MGTGLKKWRPPNLSNLCVVAAMSFMGMEDVLLVNKVSLKKITVKDNEMTMITVVTSTDNVSRYLNFIHHLGLLPIGNNNVNNRKDKNTY